MAEWIVEEGIGEHRAIRLENGEIAAARLSWPGRLAAGQVEDATLVSRQSGSPRGTLRFASGEEALIDGLPKQASEGSTIRATVTRAAMGEQGRLKLAQARPIDAPTREPPSLAEMLEGDGQEARVVRRFPDGDWNGLILEAADGTVTFAGGSLTLSPTPAMTLIDIDGTLAPRALALAAIPAIASAIRRFDLAGSIGIDFPTLAEKADRQAVDNALHAALEDWPHQRTAMNGFGFVQLVSRLEHPSLLHRTRLDPAGAAARLVLRRAEMVEVPGRLLVTLHPAVRAAIRDEWETELARRTGREIEWKIDPAIALFGGFAQAVTS